MKTIAWVGTLILTSLIMNAATGYESPKPILVNADKAYKEITSDGLESGLQIQFQVVEDAKVGPAYIDISGADNTAGCQLKNIKLVGSKRIEPETPDYFLSSYEAFVATEVFADSGGCLIWIKSGYDKTISIINYNYYVEI